jgi:hypothetical protein
MQLECNNAHETQYAAHKLSVKYTSKRYTGMKLNFDDTRMTEKSKADTKVQRTRVALNITPQTDMFSLKTGR